MTLSAAMMDRLTARGIDVELADRLGLESRRSRDGGEILAFPFKRRGELIRRKYRHFDNAEKKWGADPDRERSAWNEDCLRDESLRGLPLVITEGEFDAIHAIQAGHLRTISVPDGAPQKALDEDDLESSKKYSWLAAIKPEMHKDLVPEIILAVDGDEAGAALLQDLSVALGRFRCKFVTYPIAKDAEARGRRRLKDLNEVWEDYGQRGVIECIAKAQWLKVDGVFLMSQLPTPAPRRIFDIGFDALGDHFKLRMGDFSVWTGTPSSGKTTLVQDVAGRCAVNHGLKTAFASFEQSPLDHRRAFREWHAERREWQMTDAEKAAADAWIDEHFSFLVPGEDDDITLDWLLEKMEIAVVRFGAQWIIIDPWNEMDHQYDGRNEREDQYINRAVKTVRRFAKAFNVHVSIVAHPIKVQKLPNGTYPMPTLYDIHGGAVWHNKADLGVVMSRSSDVDTKVKVAKSRYHDLIGKPGTVIVQYCGDDRRFRETERLDPVARSPLPAEPDLLDPDVALPQPNYDASEFV